MLLAHRKSKVQFQKVRHDEKQFKGGKKKKTCNDGTAEQKRKSLEKNDFNMKYVLWRKLQNGGCRRAETEARSPRSKTRERSHAGRESRAQASAEVLAGAIFGCHLSRPGHRRRLAFEGPGPSQAFYSLSSLQNEGQGGSGDLQATRLQADPILSADTSAAPFPDTKGCLVCLTVILGCK